MKQHGRRIRMDQGRGSRIGPCFAVVVAPGRPQMTLGRSGHEEDASSAEVHRPPLVHAFESLGEPTVGTGSGQQRPRLPLILGAQKVLLRCERFDGPVGEVGADQPRSRIGLRHAHDRHSPKARVIDRSNELHLRPRMAVVIGPTKSNGCVLLLAIAPVVLTLDRLRSKCVDSLGAASESAE